MVDNENVTIRVEKRFKQFLENIAKSRFISLSALLKQGSLCWLEREGIDYSAYVKTDFSADKDNNST